MPSSGACEVCGGANETRSRFCPDCRDERESRQRRESSIRWKRSHPSLVKAEKERYRKDHLAYFATASRVYREANKEKVAAAQRVRVKRHNATLDLWKRAQGCSTCGVTEGKLHYHHIDPSSKSMSVSAMSGVSLERLYDEIAKCTVLCTKCHGAAHRELRSATVGLPAQ